MVTDIPLGLLVKTVPIYSEEVYKEQFPEEERKLKWKGYARPAPEGVYWCSRACDKYARGGKVWSVNVDDWRRNGRSGGGWDVPIPAESESEDEEGFESSGSEAVIEEEDEEEMVNINDEVVAEAAESGDVTRKKRKVEKPAKRRSKNKKPHARSKSGVEKYTVPRRKKVHPRASASRLPPTVAIETLPADPYERALRLLHVGATPESLPCREDEFVDVLSRVEEGVESGGGGCLCESNSYQC